ncbi:uncharacterized protein LOC116800981 [Drosophila sechellia]|uniref:uncharacterized protein LOC116800981 n=1 Tax=Drosophila sechellia TaxID=7238 RepID=UPI0013DE5F96|nr:uncharacterized protein LOC116800981 [Drosophila sechellia]
MIPNPIEIVCVHVVQPIIDFLDYMLMEVNFVAFLAAVACLGVIMGLILGIVTFIWFKMSRDEETKKTCAGDGMPVNVKKND